MAAFVAAATLTMATRNKRRRRSSSERDHHRRDRRRADPRSLDLVEGNTIRGCYCQRRRAGGRAVIDLTGKFVIRGCSTRTCTGTRSWASSCQPWRDSILALDNLPKALRTAARRA